MTTDEMKQSALQRFDAAVTALRNVLTEDGLDNELYPPLKKSRDNLNYAINNILRINGAINACK